MVLPKPAGNDMKRGPLPRSLPRRRTSCTRTDPGPVAVADGTDCPGGYHDPHVATAHCLVSRNEDLEGQVLDPARFRPVKGGEIFHNQSNISSSDGAKVSNERRGDISPRSIGRWSGIGVRAPDRILPPSPGADDLCRDCSYCLRLEVSPRTE
jgi:hypothetical protein